MHEAQSLLQYGRIADGVAEGARRQQSALSHFGHRNKVSLQDGDVLRNR